MKTASFTQILANRRIGIMLPLGFASGLPLALTAGTLQAWLTVVGLRPEDHRHLYARRSPVRTEILVGPIDGSSGSSLAGTPARMDAGDAALCRSRLGGHGGDWSRPASGDTRGSGSRGGLPLCLTRHRLRRLSDRCALTSGTGIRCSCLGEWLSMCAVACERRRPSVGRSYWMAKHLFAACRVNGGRSCHDPRQSGTVGAKCGTGESGRSGWWTAERTLYPSRGGRAPRPHCLVQNWRRRCGLASNGISYWRDGLLRQRGRVCEGSWARGHTHRRIGRGRRNGQARDGPVVTALWPLASGLKSWDLCVLPGWARVTRRSRHRFSSRM